jgi:hypothetical protein
LQPIVGDDTLLSAMERFGVCALMLVAAWLNAGCGCSSGSKAGGKSGAGGSDKSGGTAGTGGNGTVGSGGKGSSGSASAGRGTGGGGSAGRATGSAGSGGRATGSGGTGGSASGTGGSATGSGGTTATGALPEGDHGIAAMHPGDVGIAADPAVIYADDFESYGQGADLNKNWSAVYQNQYVTIATDTANVYAGNKALEFTLPKQTAELSDATDKMISPERDVLFLRYYSKFQPPYDVVGSSHNGSSISAHYFINGQATPGVPANGTNKFLVNLEDWRGDAATPSPGPLNVYVYHPEQRSQYGDHFFPPGTVLPNSSQKFDFGPDFVSRPDITPELGRWYCYEYMVQANTPGQRNGRIAFWLDGKLTADFGNLRFRDVDTLKIDRFGLSFHIGSNPNGESKKWYDNVVAATSYIGPLFPK